MLFSEKVFKQKMSKQGVVNIFPYILGICSDSESRNSRKYFEMSDSEKNFCEIKLTFFGHSFYHSNKRLHNSRITSFCSLFSLVYSYNFIIFSQAWHPNCITKEPSGFLPYNHTARKPEHRRHSALSLCLMRAS